jgi:DNA-binding MarR family transcriptional regulator
VNFIIKSRIVRRTFFSATLFGEPAWDILLALYAGALDDERITAKQLGKASDATSSAVERWMSALEREGLVNRASGAVDLETFGLSEKGWLAMDSYFEKLSPGTKSE